MADDGMVNVGHLVRDGHAEEGVMLVGFGSYRGSVIAGEEWEAPMERLRAIISYGLFGCLCLVSLALISGWLWG